MRSSLDDDGVRRIQAKIVVPMGIDEITAFALSNPRFAGYKAGINQFESLNKREMFQVAKESVALRGTELPTAIVSKMWTVIHQRRARKYVVGLFPEVE
jgi:hypothetical protein